MLCVPPTLQQWELTLFLTVYMCNLISLPIEWLLHWRCCTSIRFSLQCHKVRQIGHSYHLYIHVCFLLANASYNLHLVMLQDPVVVQCVPICNAIQCMCIATSWLLHNILIHTHTCSQCGFILLALACGLVLFFILIQMVTAQFAGSLARYVLHSTIDVQSWAHFESVIGVPDKRSIIIFSSGLVPAHPLQGHVRRVMLTFCLEVCWTLTFVTNDFTCSVCPCRSKYKYMEYSSEIVISAPISASGPGVWGAYGAQSLVGYVYMYIMVKIHSLFVAIV